MAKDKVKLDEKAEARLAELREEYKKRVEEDDKMRIAQILYMAKSIKSGERHFIYDFS